MKTKRLLSAGLTVLGAAALLAASGVLTVAVTMAALDGSWTQVIDFNNLGEGPIELVLAWALLPAVGWVLRGALENELEQIAAARQAESGDSPEPATVARSLNLPSLPVSGQAPGDGGLDQPGAGATREPLVAELAALGLRPRRRAARAGERSMALEALRSNEASPPPAARDIAPAPPEAPAWRIPAPKPPSSTLDFTREQPTPEACGSRDDGLAEDEHG